MDAQERRILLVGVDAEIVDAVAERVEASLERFDDMDAAAAAMAQRPAGVDVIALGREVDSPIDAAQRVSTIDRDIAVVLLGTDAGLAQIARALRFAPFLPEDITSKAVAYPDIAAEAILSAAGRTTRRRTHRTTMRRAAAQLGVPHVSSAEVGHEVLGTLLRRAPVAVVTLDSDGHVSSVNPYAARLLGRPPRDLISQPVDVLVDEPHRPQLRAVVASASSDDSPTMRVDGLGEGGTALDVSASGFGAAKDGRGMVLVLHPPSTGAERDERRQWAARLRTEVISRLDAARRLAVEGHGAAVVIKLDEAREHARSLLADVSVQN